LPNQKNSKPNPSQLLETWNSKIPKNNFFWVFFKNFFEFFFPIRSSTENVNYDNHIVEQVRMSWSSTWRWLGVKQYSFEIYKKKLKKSSKKSSFWEKMTKTKEIMQITQMRFIYQFFVSEKVKIMIFPKKTFYYQIFIGSTQNGVTNKNCC